MHLLLAIGDLGNRISAPNETTPSSSPSGGFFEDGRPLRA
jgi:hypothetical protein